MEGGKKVKQQQQAKKNPGENIDSLPIMDCKEKLGSGVVICAADAVRDQHRKLQHIA